MMRRLFTIALVLAAVTAAGAATVPTTGPVPLPPQTPTPGATAVAPPPAKLEVHALTAEDLHAFLDGFVPYALHHGDIAGATIAIVKDGHLLLAQGYGYADIAKQKPVIPDETLFRPGSISKLFTWTSVMQLKEEGKLDLDRDVNDYLDFKIPPKFGKPITLRDIMTHTSGFEEAIAELFVDKPEHLTPLGQYLARHMPERIFPPGKTVAYSNYATAMAGYIVQRVSGEPFADYVEHHIFKPLGMDHSSFQQPLQPQLLKLMSTGYRQASISKTVPYELVEASPAGALASTSTDMAKFMIAQLENGSYNGAQILKPATVKEMHSRNYTLSPALLNGMDLGFYDENRNGHRIIGHAGDTEAFHSDLHLILDSDTGIFMSFNSAGKEGDVETVRVALFRAFLDRYFPFTPPTEKTVADPKKDAARVAGYYIASRRKESVLKLLFTALTQAQVSALPDGMITVSVLKDFSGAPKKWREVGPLVYREVNGQTHLAFVTDKDGNIDYFQSDDFIPVELLQRVHGLEQTNFLLIFGGITLTAVILALVTWLGGWLVRKRFGRSLELTPAQRWRRLFSRLGALAFVLVMVGWLGFLVAISVDETLLLGGGGVRLLAPLYILGVLAILGGLAMIYAGILRALEGPGGWLVRAGELVLVLAGFWGIWAIYDYGLANFYFNL